MYGLEEFCRFWLLWYFSLVLSGAYEPAKVGKNCLVKSLRWKNSSVLLKLVAHNNAILHIKLQFKQLSDLRNPRSGGGGYSVAKQAHPWRDWSPWRTCARAGMTSKGLQPMDDQCKSTGKEWEGRCSTEKQISLYLAHTLPPAMLCSTSSWSEPYQ